MIGAAVGIGGDLKSQLRVSIISVNPSFLHFFPVAVHSILSMN